MLALSEIKTPAGSFGSLYNLGGAHFQKRYSSLESFKTDLFKLCSKSSEKNFIAITNNLQDVEREYLRAIGFEERNLENKLIVHAITRKNLLTPEAKKEVERIEEEKKERLKNRPRNKDGRLLNKDGTIKRKPYEYFVGDKIRFYPDNKYYLGSLREETIRSISGKGSEMIIKTKNHTTKASFVTEIIKRVV